MFIRYTLRTTDAASARRFYEDAVGLTLPEGAAPHTTLEAWPLHERAIAAGVPPHWLGHLEVDDLEHAAREFIELGAQPLGPTVQGRGASWATMRDPLGAVVALRTKGDAPDEPVAWHQLHTTDLDRAWSIYAKLAGFRDAGTIDAPDLESALRAFTWSVEPSGAIGNTARLPGVHPHWLFFFPVDDVEATAARIVSHGGTAMAPAALPNGRRLAACEDRERAAFGIISR